MVASQRLTTESFRTVSEFVRGELCAKNQLEKDAFQMSHRMLTRQGQPCGYYFCIHGPRSVRLTAVWDLKNGSVFFYDSLGRREAHCPVPVNN